MTPTPPLIEADGLRVSFPGPRSGPFVTALRDVTFRVEPGEFVAVIGASGAGKTTLMRSLTGFVRPTAGKLRVNGIDLTRCSWRALRRLRRGVASIHQHFNLVERLSALENVLIGLLGRVSSARSLAGWFTRQEREFAMATLDRFGLANRAHQRVDRLSGGERQRVTIARALVQQPALVLADEPAASLDVNLTRAVLETLARLNREENLTVLVNLHDIALARAFSRRAIALREGERVFDGSFDQLSDHSLEEIYRGDTAPDSATTEANDVPRSLGPSRPAAC